MRTKKEKESKILSALLYVIIIVTVAMLAPLINKVASDYSDSVISAPGDSEAAGDRNIRNRKYTVTEKTIDISGLRNTEFGVLNLIKAKISDSGDIILLCSARVEIPAAVNDGDAAVNPNAPPYVNPVKYEDVMRIAVIKNIEPAENETPDGGYNGSALIDLTEVEAAGVLEIQSRPVRNDFLASVRDGEYTFKDYGDGTFFMSNSKTAFLFDSERIRTAASYSYPSEYNIYQTALSNDKNLLAIASEEGFFVGNLAATYNMGLNQSNMKEIIAPVTVNGVQMSARYPSWSGDDSRIYYKLYADSHVQSAGVTTPSPGGNEQLTSLECSNFIFLANDSIFYYFPPGTGTNPAGQFRCGYFNANEKRMTDVMKSQVYYFDIDASPNGTHLAALSYNGNMIKISVTDILTKKLIYSSLYREIYDYSFSPDEKSLIIYGRTDERRNTLRVIDINWTEE